MDKQEILQKALKDCGKKESTTILCISMLESLYERIDLKDLQDIRWFLAKYHRKYYKIEDLKIFEQENAQLNIKETKKQDG